MCGRFALITDLTKIAEQFDVGKTSTDFQPNWNITPGQYVPAVVHRNGQNILEFFLWGLIPFWAKDPAIGKKLINARAETISDKPSFRSALETRRCLIIADGFYEWRLEGKKKMPLYFYLQSGKPFGLAGLYETWISPDKKQINTCTIITTDANEMIKSIHDRMPVIIPGELEQAWLNDKNKDKTDLVSGLKPYPAEKMNCKAGMGPAFT